MREGAFLERAAKLIQRTADPGRREWEGDHFGFVLSACEWRVGEGIRSEGGGREQTSAAKRRRLRMGNSITNLRQQDDLATFLVYRNRC